MGTTMLGGTALCRKVQGCGTVFKLSPSPKAGRTIVYSFTSAGTGSIMAAVRGCTQARQSVWHSIQWRKTTNPALLGQGPRSRLTRRMRVSGFLAENPNNPLMQYSQEAKQFPYKSRVGEVQTNGNMESR